MAIVERHAGKLQDRARPQDRAPSVIEFRGVSKTYAPGDTGLDNVASASSAASSSSSSGSTGSGKSTLMRLLIKEHEPTAGTIRVAGRDLAEIDRKKVPFYRRNIGVVFQDFKLLPNRTVYDNVAYALQVTGHSRKEIRAKVPDILRLTGLALKLHNYPDQLSGGEQQRVSVARAFVNHPPLLLADEPTGNLDPETVDRDHAAALPHQPHRHDRPRRDARPRDGRPHAPPRDRARARAASSATSAVGAYAQADLSTAEFGALLRGEPAARAAASCHARRRHGRPLRRAPSGERSTSEPRLLLQGGAALDQRATRSRPSPPWPRCSSPCSSSASSSPSCRRRPARPTRSAAACSSTSTSRRTPPTPTSSASRQRLADTAHVGNVEYVSKEDAYKERKRDNPEAYELLGSNPLPDTFRDHAGRPRQRR